MAVPSNLLAFIQLGHGLVDAALYDLGFNPVFGKLQNSFWACHVRLPEHLKQLGDKESCFVWIGWIAAVLDRFGVNVTEHLQPYFEADAVPVAGEFVSTLSHIGPPYTRRFAGGTRRRSARSRTCGSGLSSK